jgi:4'-phosphopantetheinyl transferase
MTEVLHGMRVSGILPTIVARAIFSDLPDWRPARPDNAVSLPEGSVDLWFAPLAASGPSDDDVLSEPERQRALAMRESTLRRHFIAARVLLRRLLGAYSNRAPDAVSIDIGPHGKPGLSNDPSLAFNISHSGDLLLIAIGATPSVGVDCERPRSVANAERLAERVFTDAERAGLRAAAEQSDAARDAFFLRHWTRKEALLKAFGSGFTRSPRELDTLAATTNGYVLDSFGLPGAGHAALARPSSAIVRAQYRYDF